MEKVFPFVWLDFSTKATYLPITNIYIKLFHDKTSSGADITLSCGVPNALFSFFERVSDLLSSPFELFLLKRTEILVKLLTNCRYTLHKLRNDFKFVEFHRGFKV